MSRKAIAAALCAALCAGALAGCAPEAPEAAAPEPGAPPASPEEAIDTEEVPLAAPAPVHEHIWVRDYAIEATDAVTETVHHDAVEEQTVETHTVCNVCLEPVDGRAAEHEAETGHAGSTPNVEVPVTATVAEAWDEVVEVEPARTALVSRTETCADCGEVREAPEREVAQEGAALPPEAAGAPAPAEGAADAA